MAWQHIVFIPLLAIAGVLCAALSIFSWSRRSAPGAIPFAITMFAVAWWTLGYTLQLIHPTLEGKLFWVSFEFFGVVTTPVAWLVFALQYTEKNAWLKGRNILALSIIPALIIMMVITNNTYGLIWPAVELVESGDFPILSFTYGPGYWSNVVYAYSLLMIGAVLFIRSLIQSTKLQRGQIWVLLMGTAAPWLANIVTVINPSSLGGLDLTPFAFTITGLALSWGLYGFRLFDIVPVARHALIENMSDGVIVLDTSNRLVDINPTTERILNRPASEILGQPAEVVFAESPDLLERFLHVEKVETEVVYGSGERQFTYNLRISPLYDRRSQMVGRLVIWRNITERKIAEIKLQRQLKELTVLHALASAGAEATSEDDLIAQATNTVGTALFPNNFGVLLLDEKSNVLREHISYQRERVEGDLLVIPLGEGVAGTVAETGEPWCIGEVSDTPIYMRVYADIHSELCVPIKVGREVIGVINAESSQVNAYTQADERLLLTLAGQLATAIEKVRLFEEVQHLAVTDSLTNIHNRRHFFDLAEKEFERAKRYHKKLAAIMIDLDNFKKINDTFGHAVGDHVLRVVADRFGEELREVDVLGRYGGEEFSIILPETDLNGAQQLGERICQKIANSTIETDKGAVSLTLSIGIASLDENCISLEALLNRADQALYTAKGSGRNCVGVWKI
ncbi:MAG: diguanylate cyclase [Chloroflexi bacterium]|nr:diguanylate cyclase [Chloroflexota bacterium]